MQVNQTTLSLAPLVNEINQFMYKSPNLTLKSWSQCYVKQSNLISGLISKLVLSLTHKRKKMKISSPGGAGGKHTSPGEQTLTQARRSLHRLNTCQFTLVHPLRLRGRSHTDSSGSGAAAWLCVHPDTTCNYDSHTSRRKVEQLSTSENC